MTEKCIKCGKKTDEGFGFYCRACWLFHCGHAPQWWGVGKSNLHLRCKWCKKILTDKWELEACGGLDG